MNLSRFLHFRVWAPILIMPMMVAVFCACDDDDDEGNDDSSTTDVPVVTTATSATNITPSSATLGGNVTGAGDGSDTDAETDDGTVSERGVVYSTTNNEPKVDGDDVTKLPAAAAGTGMFTVDVMGLAPNTKYYFAAYATNEHGTAHGDTGEFTTLEGPTISSPTSADVTENSATLGGDITSDAGLTITERGVIFSRTIDNDNPFIAGPNVTKVPATGTGTGVFTHGVTGLDSFTSYSFRAYVSVAEGTSYTDVEIFVTESNVPVDSDILTTVTQADGKILVGGTFSMIGGVAQGGIARLHPDLTVDTSFTPDVGGDINTMEVQADGKILIGGYINEANGVIFPLGDNHVVRLNPDGTTDTSFSAYVVSGTLLSLVLQEDGKIIVAGEFLGVNDEPDYWWLGRLNSDGTTDTSFNPGVVPNDPNDPVHSIAVQPDGKILIGGWFKTYNGVSRVGIARLNENGSLDTTFDPGTGTGPGYPLTVRSIALQSDGKIVIGGEFISYNGTNRSGIARLDADGSLDSSFDPGTGLFRIPPVPDDFVGAQVTSITIQRDGGILIGGNFDKFNGILRKGLARILPSGDLDPTLGQFFEDDVESDVESVALLNDGTILVGAQAGPDRIPFAALPNKAFPADSSVPAGPGDPEPEPAPALGRNGAFSQVSATSLSRVQWLRGGTTPLLSDVLFEVSTNAGSTWTDLGDGVWTDDGWELTGLSLPPTGLVRGRGTTHGGNSNGGSGLIEEESAYPIPVLTELTVAEVMPDSATLGATAATFGSAITERGVVFSATTDNDDPMIGGANVTKVAATGAGVGAFTVPITGLSQDVEYSFRAYAITAAGTGYSWASSFSTKVPVLNSLSSANETASGASLMANLTNAGGSAITERGFVFSRVADNDAPVLDGPDVRKEIVSGIEIEEFSKHVTDLVPGTAYRVKAFATNSVGTGYSASLTFSTSGAPRIESAGENGITETGATLEAEVVDDGGSPVTVRGIVYGPTSAITEDRLFSDETDATIVPAATGGTGAFSVPLTGLDSDTLYTWAAYATNEHGTVYSGEAVFNTLPPPPDPIGTPDPGGNDGLTSSGAAGNGALEIAEAGVTAGTLDALFDSGVQAGKFVQCIAVQADGSSIIAGDFESVGSERHLHIARVGPDGTVDSTFKTEINVSVNSIVVQADGKILLGGLFTKVNGVTRNGIARLNSDGTLESVNTFSPGAGADAVVYAVALQPDGKILIAGLFDNVQGTPRPGIARLKANGILDTTFDPGTGADNAIYSISVQPDGKILIGGHFTAVNGTNRNRIARLDSTGSVDVGFDPGTGADDRVAGIAAQTDGSILVSGYFTTINGTSRNRIARLTSTGALDTGFDPGTGANDRIYTFTTQVDGKIVIGGTFTNYNGTAINRIAKLNPDGSLDTAFDPGAGADDEVDAITLQEDGSILVGGLFQFMDGSARKGLARLANEDATQSLTVSGRSSLKWARGGAGPAIAPPEFEISTDLGMIWESLGTGAVTSDGWELNGLDLPVGGMVRSIGCTNGGFLGGSSGVMEGTLDFDYGPQILSLRAQLRSTLRKISKEKKKLKKAKKKRNQRLVKKSKKNIKKLQKKQRSISARLAAIS